MILSPCDFSTSEPTAQETISIFTFQEKYAIDVKKGFLTFLEKTAYFANDLPSNLATAVIRVVYCLCFAFFFHNGAAATVFTKDQIH